MANTTWDPASVTAVTLSGGNLVATNTGTTSADQGAHVASTFGKTAGKFYFEVTWTTLASGTSSNVGIGIGTTASTYTGMGNGGTTGVTYYGGGSAWSNGSNVLSSVGPWVAGQTAGFAVDLDNRRIWCRSAPNGAWNFNTVNGDPVANVGGRVIPAGTMVPFATFGGTGGVANDKLTANFGDTPFIGVAPVGFASGWPTTFDARATQVLVEEWGAASPAAQLTQLLVEEWAGVIPPPFTSWSPGDKSASLAPSNNNLTATNTVGAPGGIRALDRQITGKFYWEHTLNARASTTGFAGGVAAGTGLVSNSPTTAGTQACGVTFSGTIWSDNVNWPTSLPTIVAGNVVCIAVDAAARLIWFRVGAAGNWNNSTSADPATRTGGVPISVGLGIPLYPAVWLTNLNDQVTANFGDTAFTGTVPSGFTAGFPAGAVTPNNELATQIAAEQWGLMIPPDMRATQAAIEQWTSTANVTTRMLLTQEAIEQWSTVAEASAITARQAALTVVT